ncbi:MAG: hypothetical protein KDD11_08175 [Acidobacteria bacterium]|nr:hypothetical protein [Acidobacteriota bacterium]
MHDLVVALDLVELGVDPSSSELEPRGVASHAVFTARTKRSFEPVPRLRIVDFDEL